jgi:hypothetical protein
MIGFARWMRLAVEMKVICRQYRNVTVAFPERDEHAAEWSV